MIVRIVSSLSRGKGGRGGQKSGKERTGCQRIFSAHLLQLIFLLKSFLLNNKQTCHRPLDISSISMQELPKAWKASISIPTGNYICQHIGVFFIPQTVPNSRKTIDFVLLHSNASLLHAVIRTSVSGCQTWKYLHARNLLNMRKLQVDEIVCIARIGFRRSLSPGDFAEKIWRGPQLTLIQ